jgi:hypothetical protein
MTGKHPGTGLSEEECLRIVQASIDPDRVLGGIDGHEGGPPDVLLTTVAEILAARDAEARAEIERLTRELSSTQDALVFSNESVEVMREKAKRGVGICWHGTCRQPATAFINEWPLCGEHDREHDSIARAERAEAKVAKCEALAEEWDLIPLGNAPVHYGSDQAFAWWHVWEGAAEQLRAALAEPEAGT